MRFEPEPKPKGASNNHNQYQLSLPWYDVAEDPQPPDSEANALSTGSGADNKVNRSNDDTSMKLGRNIYFMSLYEKKVLATWNSKMAAIFQDGRQMTTP